MSVSSPQWDVRWIVAPSPQVVLYSLMMAERQDWDPQEGLLLYLRDGVDMRWVASPHRDRGALVQRRNELAQCLQPGARLPPPIDSERHCPKCPHAVVCSAFRGCVVAELVCTTCLLGGALF